MESSPETILVVAFGGVAVDLSHRRDVVFALLKLALTDAGVDVDHTTIEDHGDRALILLPPDVSLSRLTAQFLGQLADGVGQYNDSRSAREAIHLMVGLHVGAASESAAIAFALRMVDATGYAWFGGELAVLASDDFYRDVIAITPVARPGAYYEISLSVKGATSRVWVRLFDTDWEMAQTVPTKASTLRNKARPTTAYAIADRSLADVSRMLAQVNDLPVSIYVSDEAVHEQVEAAVEELLAAADLEITVRDDPVRGSWFRHMWARARQSVRSPRGREIIAMALHAAESRAVHAHDAEVTAKLMQNLGPLIAALQPTEHAVVRVGALLIVKRNGVVGVHQLTAAQQLTLDHTPHLAALPHQILEILEVAPDQD